MVEIAHALPHVAPNPSKPKRSRTTLAEAGGAVKPKRQRAKPKVVIAPLTAPTEADISNGATLTAPYEWSCECPDFQYRGAYKNPPSCKHILAIVHTLRGNQQYINREGLPVFLNEGGPLGFTPENKVGVHACRQWWVTPQSKPSGYWVVQRNYCDHDSRVVSVWMGS